MIDLIKPNFPSCMMIGSGSSILKTYLPESDIDLVFFTDNDDNDKDDSSKASCDSIDDTKSIFRILNALCDEIIAKESGTSINNDMTIRNVEFINARTKVVHCFVNNINIDITINQIGAVASAAFLEEADRLIGYDHLFKKSLLLIKCWCLNESIKYCGNPILGSKQGMFSSYAISVLVLHLFNQYSNSLTHPFSVLRAFLSTYASFRWENFILTIDGPIAITSNTNNKLAAPTKKTDKVFESLISQFQNLMNKSKYKRKPSNEFPIRCCCILDPIDHNNNLGISISRQNLNIISQALKNGYHHLETILAWNHEQNNRMHVLLNVFFPESYDLYIADGMIRCDLRDHPLQKYTNFEKTVLPISNANEADKKDVLQTNIISIWTTLTEVGLSLDSKDSDGIARDSGTASPPSVAATYALSSSIFSPGSSDEGNAMIDDDLVYKYNGINESKVNIDTDMSNDNGPLKIDAFDYTKPQSPRSSSFLVSDYDSNWGDGVGLTSPTAQYLLNKSFKTPGVDKEIQTDEEKPTTPPCNYNNSNSNIEVTNPSTVNTTSTSDSIPKYENVKPDDNTITASTNTATIIVTSNNTTKTNSNVQKKKGKNNKANNNNNANNNSGNSNTNVALKLTSGGNVTDSKGAAADGSTYALLKKVKPLIIRLRPAISLVCAIVIALAAILIYRHSVQNEKSITVSEVTNVTVPRDVRKRSNYWIIKGDSLSFGEMSYIDSLSSILAQVNNKTEADFIAHNSVFQWRKDGLNLTNPSKDTTLYTIQDSKESDSGIYSLVTVGGSANGIVLTEIKISMSIAPSIKSKPKYFNEKKRGETLKIELAGEGMPPPYFQWFRNGVQLVGKVNNVLIIENIDKSDGGTYSCVLTNVAGSYHFQEVIVVVS